MTVPWKRRPLAYSGVLFGMSSIALAGCEPSAAESAAQAAMEACQHSDSAGLMRVEGATLYVEVTGANARAVARGDLADSFDVEYDYIAIAECLAVNTDFPGMGIDLRNGDSWDGWTYREESGPGSEMRRIFTSTV